MELLTFKYDEVADAATIYLRHPLKFGEVVRSGGSGNVPEMTSVLLEFEKKDKLVGIEILGAKKLLPRELLKAAHYVIK